MIKRTISILLLLFFILILHNQCQTKKVEVSPVNLDLLTFNIWHEGTSVPNGMEKIRDVIIATAPDVVGFSEINNYENEDWTTKIVNELAKAGIQYHKSYVGGDVSMISKYPITASSMIYEEGGAIARFDLDINGSRLVIATAHLDYRHYACYLPRGYNGSDPDWEMIDDGSGNPSPVTDPSQILTYNLASMRDEQIQAFINAVDTISVPVILMGDFNEPSHLDWTAGSASMFERNGAIIPWQTTTTLEKNGFKDAYREFFPDEIKNPGITWPSFVHEVGSTSWTPKSDDRDRIDYIFYKGETIQTNYAALVGPKASYAFNQIDFSHTKNENFMADTLAWPSDHKAVLVTLSWQAGQE